jgi:hypothetical protein
MGEGVDQPSDSARGPDKGERRLVERFREAMRARDIAARAPRRRTGTGSAGSSAFMTGGIPRSWGGGGEAFLSWLATPRDVAAATQNQALSAILFLYKHVLGEELPWLAGLVRAQRPEARRVRGIIVGDGIRPRRRRYPREVMDPKPLRRRHGDGQRA